MADLAASAVTINDTWWDGDRWGKNKWLCRDVTLVLTGQGTDSNSITAAILGFSEIHQIDACMADDDRIQPGSPNYARTKILLYNVEVATDANRADPVDITDTIRLIVKGKEA